MDFKLNNKVGGQVQSIPPLFQEIIENDAALRITKASPVVSMEKFRHQRARQIDCRKHAELRLQGTKDKGTKL
jgi:hypothetical protein